MLSKKISIRIVQKNNRISFSTFGVFAEGERAREREFIRKEEQEAFELLRQQKRKHLADELKIIIDKNPTPITKLVFDSLLDWKVDATIEGGVKDAPCFQHDQDRDTPYHVRSRGDIF